jgi:K+-sensing histidine kinase KdpD
VEDSFPCAAWHLSLVSFRAVPIRNANGAVIRWFGTNTDTTEIKEAEEKLVEYQQGLEAIVEERTKDLLEKEQSLESQNQELHKTELDRFVYSTSHDLRAPLKSMLGLIAIVKRK